MPKYTVVTNTVDQSTQVLCWANQSEKSFRQCQGQLHDWKHGQKFQLAPQLDYANEKTVLVSVS